MSDQSTLVYLSERKKIFISYILLLFLGQLGIHRFYIGNKKMGILILILTVIGFSTLFFYVGIGFLSIMVIILLIDLFRMPKLTRKYNIELLNKLNLPNNLGVIN